MGYGAIRYTGKEKREFRRNPGGRCCAAYGGEKFIASGGKKFNKSTKTPQGKIVRIGGRSGRTTRKLALREVKQMHVIKERKGVRKRGHLRHWKMIAIFSPRTKKGKRENLRWKNGAEVG